MSRCFHYKHKIPEIGVLTVSIVCHKNKKSFEIFELLKKKKKNF